MNKRKFIIYVVLTLICHNISAQAIDPERYHNNIEAGVGIQGIPNSHNGVDLRLDLSYGYFSYKGIGFRTGVTYTPEMLEIGKAVGAPVAFAWRTFQIDRSYSTDPIDYGSYDPDYMLYQDYSDYVKEQIATGLLRFITQIASNLEIAAGVTPGYIFGKRADSFYMTGDLGVKTSWRIWRFNLSINPAMHYLLTDSVNMGTHKVRLSSFERWQLSLLFSINIMI